MITSFLFFLVIIFSYLFTELIRRYYLKSKVLDIPGDRDLHLIPKPRGGGLSIVIIFLIVVIFSDLIPINIVFALVGSGILVAVIGYCDDQGHIAARWRLLSHFSAAFWTLFYLGGLPEFYFLGLSIDAGWIGFVIVAFILVWLLNLFNFMDGIDGIAASEAIFVSCGGAFFSWLNGAEGLAYISLTLAASTMGFLFLNWYPAKIFMGDVGSGFLGIILGVIAYANIIDGCSVWIWFILLGVFLVDSGITLLRRIINRDKLYKAHCSHAYQHAAQKWGHKRVSIIVIIINLFWLFPLAIFVHSKPDLGLFFLLIAYIPLIFVALKFKAGLKQTDD